MIMDDWFIDYDIDININNKVLTKMVYSYYEYSNYGRKMQNPLTKFI